MLSGKGDFQRCFRTSWDLPIRFTSARRNEIKTKIPAGTALSAMNGVNKDISISSKEQIVQRASLLLKDGIFKNKDTSISLDNLNRLCFMLEMQPRDII